MSAAGGAARRQRSAKAPTRALGAVARLVGMAALAGCAAAPPGGNGGSPLPGESYCSPAPENPQCQLASLSLALEVTPKGARTDLVAVEWASVVPDERGAISVQLPEPVAIIGNVLVSGASAGSLRGAVLATRPSRIPGGADRSYQAPIDENTGAFHLLVDETEPGEVYTLSILAADPENYPPQYFTVDASIAPGTAREVHFDLHLDDPSMLTQVSGVVSDVVARPIAGMQVLAVDPVTGRRVSTVAVSDADGRYAILLSRQLPSTSLQLLATPTASAPKGTPTLELSLDATLADPTTHVIAANLPTPALPAAQPFTYRVVGIGSSGAEQVVAGATCRFKATVTDPNSPSHVGADSVASGTTDADGVVTVYLIPSDSKSKRVYDYSISPAADSQFQVKVDQTASGDTPGFGGDLLLELRPQVTGRVVASDGQPIGKITIEPGPDTLTARAAQATSDTVRSTSSVSGADGRFGVRLNAGGWSLGLIPDSSLFLPRRYLESVQVEGDLDLGDILLPGAALGSLSLQAPDAQPLADALISLYSLRSENAACAPGDGDCLTPPRLLAQGLTDSQGRMGLLLPVAASTQPGVR